ncbi:fimbrial chaperone protein precursor [Enterobacterales bacterium]|nr:fimbrial chaperone protein precursor [Enterobacterales bacterium]
MIYHAEKKEASLTVQNKDKKEEFLIQTWVEDAGGNKKTSFIVTPPLFRLDPLKDNILRIVNIGGVLPQDRESVYWLNVKAIPSHSDNADTANVLQIAVRTRLKLFYRPQGLTGTPEDNAPLLSFKQSGNQLVVTNPGSYNLSFDHVALDKKPLEKTGMVPAKGTLTLTLPANTARAAQVEYSLINDFGASSQSYSHVVQ